MRWTLLSFGRKSYIPVVKGKKYRASNIVFILFYYSVSHRQHLINQKLSGFQISDYGLKLSDYQNKQIKLSVAKHFTYHLKAQLF